MSKFSSGRNREVGRGRNSSTLSASTNRAPNRQGKSKSNCFGSSIQEQKMNGFMLSDSFFYLFEAGYVRAERYLTKSELKEMETFYGKFKGYVTPAEKLLEFTVCEQIEKAIERFLRG